MVLTNQRFGFIQAMKKMQENGKASTQEIVSI
jgi:hypothetical protein